jgi:hypothetical protein
MKKNLIITAVVLVLSVAAYALFIRPRLKAAPTPQLVVKPQTHKEAIDTLRIDSTVAEKPIELTALSEKDTKALFDTTDLSKVLSSIQPIENDKPYIEIFNGFYGPDHYRIEFYVDKVSKDASNPFRYLLSGKTRYKKNIVPFSGEINLQEFYKGKDPNIEGVENFYSTIGEFKLKEDSKVKGNGTFSGKVAIDFNYNQYDPKIKPEVGLWFYNKTSSSKGGGFLLEGNWKKNALLSNDQKSFIVAKDLFMIADDILPHFSIGERDVEVNPKYRHLGWDNFWENDEWWADSPAQ